MPAIALKKHQTNLVDDYIVAMTAVGRRTGRSTVQAAKAFCTKLEHAGGFECMTRTRRLDAVRKARAFASWLMVTGQLRVDADVLGRLDLRLGGVAANYCPHAHRWFVEACDQIGVRPADVSIQWNALVKITAITGTPPDQVGDTEFASARSAISRGLRGSRPSRLGSRHGLTLPPAPAHVVPCRAAHQSGPARHATRRSR